jgi:cytokinin dehydrogenase
VVANRALFDRVRAVGGYFYPIDSVPMDVSDWRRHFGPRWPRFVAAKRTFDPSLLLAAGQGIFPGSEED